MDCPCVKLLYIVLTCQTFNKDSRRTSVLTCICSNDLHTRNSPQRILIGALGLASAALVINPIGK